MQHYQTIKKIKQELLVSGVVKLEDFNKITVTELLDFYKAYKKKEQERMLQTSMAFMLSRSPKELGKMAQKLEDLS